MGKNNHFPMIFSCPACRRNGLLHRHGFYKRNVIVSCTKEEYRIVICRLKCNGCQKAFSVIPDFLIPYFQYSLVSVLALLRKAIRRRHVQKSMSRQLLSHYMRRFCRQLNWVHSFFVDQGIEIGRLGEEKERATKYLTMIRDFGESTFLRRSKGHLSTYFMASSFYHSSH